MTDSSTRAATGPDGVRAATFNASLNRNAEGELVADLAAPDNWQAQTVAEIVQRAAPDLLLMNEFDYVPVNAAADLFRSNYLEQGQDTLGLGSAAARSRTGSGGVQLEEHPPRMGYPGTRHQGGNARSQRQAEAEADKHVPLGGREVAEPMPALRPRLRLDGAAPGAKMHPVANAQRMHAGRQVADTGQVGGNGSILASPVRNGWPPHAACADDPHLTS